MHILFLFVDGIGLGDPTDDNPFFVHRLPAFERLSCGQRWLCGVEPVSTETCVFRPIDPRLSTPGLPQSGTGQATLFTGVNCAELIGKHYGPYPYSTTKPVIAEKNVFKQIEQLFPDDPEPAAFANAYPGKFFDYVKKTDRWTVTTRCCLDSNTRIRSTEDLTEGLAVPADLIGTNWPDDVRDGQMPGDEQAAGERLCRIASNHKLTLFEYFLTDKAGHRRSTESAEKVLFSLDRLLAAVLDAAARPESELLVVLTSDHGNLEDLSVKTHTRNDVPFAALGESAGELADVRRLADVTPALVRLLRESA